MKRLLAAFLFALAVSAGNHRYIHREFQRRGPDGRRRVIHRINVALCALWLTFAPVFAQGIAPWQPGSYQPAPSGASYTGPGDVVSGWLAYLALRCYNTAYTGFVADITDAATGTTTGTRLKCASGGVISAVVGSTCANTSAAAGGGAFVTGGVCSALATTCAVACRVLTLYDQSGANNCAGSVACDVTQATNANRPTFNQSCTGLASGAHTWCIVGSSSASTLLRSVNKITGGSQPQSVTLVTYYTSAATNNDNGIWFGDICCGNGIGIYLDVVLSNIRLNGANAVIFNPFALNTWYSEQATWNGAAGISNVNSTTSSGLATGTDGSGNGFVSVLSDSGTASCDCNFVEGDLLQSALTAPQQASLVTNQRSTTFGWGF